MEMIKKYKLTAIHVTHNQEEAMTISDNIIMMKEEELFKQERRKKYMTSRILFSRHIFSDDVIFFNAKKRMNTMLNFKIRLLSFPEKTRKGKLFSECVRRKFI